MAGPLLIPSTSFLAPTLSVLAPVATAPASNMAIYTNAGRTCLGDFDADFGAATSVSAIYVEANSLAVTERTQETLSISGGASIGASTFQIFPVMNQDPRTGRFKLYCPLTAFNFRWLRVAWTHSTEAKVNFFAAIPAAAPIALKESPEPVAWSIRQSQTRLALPSGGFALAVEGFAGLQYPLARADGWRLSDLTLLQPLIAMSPAIPLLYVENPSGIALDVGTNLAAMVRRIEDPSLRIRPATAEVQLLLGEVP